MSSPSSVKSPVAAKASSGGGWREAIDANLAARNAQQVQPFQYIVASYNTLLQQHGKATADLAAARTTLTALTTKNTDLSAHVKELENACKGVTLKSAKERELEEKVASLTQQLSSAFRQANMIFDLQHTLQAAQSDNAQLKERVARSESELGNAKMKVTRLEQAAADRERTVALLKNEVEALQQESRLQRDQFKSTREENARLMPMVMEAKKKEGEYMNQLLEMEAEVKRLRQQLRDGGGGGGGGGQLLGDDFVDIPPGSVPMFGQELARTKTDYGSIIPTSLVREVENCNDGVRAVCFSEHSRHVWTGGGDKMLTCWDAGSGQSIHSLSTVGTVMSIDQQGDIVMAACADQACRLWQVSTLRSHCQLTGHTEKVTSARFTFDGRQAVTGSSDRTMKLWDLDRNGSLISTITCFSSCNDVAVTSNRIWSAHFDSNLRSWDPRIGKLAGEVKGAHSKTVTGVRATEDGKSVVSVSKDCTVRLIDVRTLSVVSVWTHDDLSIGGMVRVGLSPDAAYCAAGSDNGSLFVWSLTQNTGDKPIKVHRKVHKDAVTAVTWSGDGMTVASIGSDNALFLWK